MKKLNKKGFTLIELLAVIVILAVVLVVTVPSVLNTIADTRQKAYEEEVEIIERYVNDEYEKCKYGLEESDYNSEILNSDCSLNKEDEEELSANILSVTGYEDEIEYIDFYDLDEENGKYKVKNALVSEDGNFKGVQPITEDDNALPGNPLDIDPGDVNINPGGGGIVKPTDPTIKDS